MTDSSPQQWFLRLTEEEQGPYDMHQLLALATRGAIVASTPIRSEGSETWSTAETLDALKLEWEVHPETGLKRPACHVLALQPMVENEEIQPYWEIIHLPSGEDYNVVDALCSSLLEQKKDLEQRLEDALALPPMPELPPDAESDPENRDILLAFRTLESQLEHVHHSLELRTRQLEQARSETDRLADELNETRKRADEAHKETGHLQKETEAQLVELERSHADLIRAYRELNDRAIRKRHPVKTPSSSPDEPSGKTPEAPAEESTTPLRMT